ncbi:MAG: 16S rRNA (guanine(966)-N(2))-methyltransferase RsmD [Crocinitomicaceae bacterium]|nr:16S rRNA (guanine(966)-N(2))-methyltransferase RsmD [Crocinitomicaceae bacterium]
MRIIRGKYKTRRYAVPKGFPSRPTTDFAKEGLFNVLEHQFVTDDMDILDLCAGSGNISVEFLSRELGHVTAVDSNYNCVRYMKSMAKKLDCESDFMVIKSDVLKFLGKIDSTYDMIFADPPYKYEHHADVVKTIFDRNLLNEDGVLVVEHGKETSLENITQFKFIRIYGGVHFSFFQREDEL